MQLELDQRIAQGCKASEVLTTPWQMSDTPEFGQRTSYLILSISLKDRFINSPPHSLLVSGWSRCLWKMPRKAPSKIYPGFAAKLIEPGQRCEFCLFCSDAPLCSETSGCTLYLVLTVIYQFCCIFFRNQATLFVYVLVDEREWFLEVKELLINRLRKKYLCGSLSEFRKLQSMEFRTARGGINSSIVFQILFDDSEDSYFISIGLKTHADG